jgi:transcriptional regulator GlxA family with amidase domain
MTAVTLSHRSSLASMTADLLRSASALSTPQDTAVLGKLGASMVELIAAAFEADVTGPGECRDRQATLLKRAKDLMKSRLDDPTLDVDGIAQALNVSPSTLSRAFAAEGTTVIRCLWNLRLAAAHVALNEGRAQRVLDIALGCVFASASHFSRMYKSAHGVLPHAVLRSSERSN